MKRSFLSVVLLLFIKIEFTITTSYNKLNLPLSHIGNYFNRFPLEKTKCLNDNECIYKDFLNKVNGGEYNENSCWGYEKNCDRKSRFSEPECKEKLSIEGQNQNDVFYKQADFGYVKDQINELTSICQQKDDLNESSLECSKNLRFCRGKNIYIDFKDISYNDKPFRYKIDVLKHGQIGGNCKLNKQKLSNEIDYLGALQSWAPELRFFKTVEKSIYKVENCDLVINKPTIIMKLDAQSNMYHHFCDFFNLYLSLHVNQTHPHIFSKDVQIIIWETFNYYSPFGETFEAFTENPLLTLRELSGRKVCFTNLLLPLLPRMIFGLYYNTPVVNNCGKSGAFKAFSEFILHRLNIPKLEVDKQKVRITFIVRKTKYRRVLNEKQLLEALKNNSSYIVKATTFEAINSFKKQLEIVRNTDVLIGMHGAGLTHLLFLPDWATIFELYNCGDPNCYKDLARLRGINYVTWENESKIYPEDEGNHPDGGAHEKFTNYMFDKDEFLRMVQKAAEQVLINFTERKNHLKNFQKNIDEL